MMRRTMLLLASMALTLLVASGLALAVNKVGTQGRDFLKGTDKADNLIGNGETDLIFGLAGNDNLLGGSGKDLVFGGTFEPLGGDKNLVGGDGNDAIQGGKGSDNLVGGDGNDFMLGGEFAPPAVRDTLSAGPGGDVIDGFNKPAGKDVVTCGGGLDRVFADRADVVAPDCERVFVGERKFDAYIEAIPQSFWEGLPPPFAQFPSKPQDYAKARGLAKAFEKANINPLVGDWRRKRTCEEYVSRLRQAGLGDQIPSHRELLAEFGAGAASGQDSAGPCKGVNGRLAHDHIFYRDGLFRSVDQDGNFVDDGHYRLPNDHTIVFPGSGITAHFRFSDHLNTVTFNLVLPKNLDECSDSCRGDYAWAVSVFYSGLPWHRVCQADHEDNNVFGRTDELGETCWVDPMKIEDRLD